MKLNQTAKLFFNLAIITIGTLASGADATPPEAIPGGTALRHAIKDLDDTFQGKYPKAGEFLKRLDDLEGQAKTGGNVQDNFNKLKTEALLANPLINFDKLLLIKRKANSLGLPQNWQGNCATGRYGYDNEIAVLSPVSQAGNLTTLFKPDGSEFVGDVDLNFDAGKMIFSMTCKTNRHSWEIYEIQADGSGLRQVTTIDGHGIDNYDPCYLPNGKIIFASTRCFAGVPCVGGGNTVANLCIMDADGSNLRMLCFDQDHNWCPTVLNDGRVMFSRWEYSDLPHYFSRLLFRMNPDGTGQTAQYGSNSYWPNSIFYARPIPNHPTKIIAVISGHHGVPRMGELLIFDPAKGRQEAAGAVQRIPGYGKEVKPVTADGLVEGSWPKFLHPYPLSDKYFIVSAKPTRDSLWGIYLVDIFDNMTLIKEVPDYVLFEPLPFRKTPTPPIIPSRVNTNSSEATIYLSDIYSGPGLKGVPRGTVKKLRVLEPHYSYPGMGGHIEIGIDGPWDVHRIHGTVPVNKDGSAVFTVPANTPLALQPLDAEGKALQVMRSWFTAMPGEVLSCVGCHEKQNTTAASRGAMAYFSKPKPITPWYGPDRGFSFRREVQPVLDKYCVGCHKSGSDMIAGLQRIQDGRGIPDFTPDRKEGNFDAAYVALHPFVRRPGNESDYYVQNPMEYHADTSELIQMLRKGHYNVKLDAEALDRLTTWIDLNVPDFGTWHEQRHLPASWDNHKRRLEARTKYANRPEDPEAIPVTYTNHLAFVKPEAANLKSQISDPKCDGWPFDAAEAKKRQDALPKREDNLKPDKDGKVKLDLGGGIVMEFAAIPAGEFVMGDTKASPEEQPLAKVKIAKPFLMARTEVSNELYKLFDNEHDTAYINYTAKDIGSRGRHINSPKQPVSRISWQEANEFCKWLSTKTGRKFTLPTEAQWEWACRAGTSTPFFYGDYNTDFRGFANLADKRIANLANGSSPKWHPKDDRFDDEEMLPWSVGRGRPNPWGLTDMHGDVKEWTRTAFKAYPYNDNDGRNNLDAKGKRVVRGGSWFDRPYRATSAYRLAYEPYQKVFDVGFRVVCEE